jgi:hypothetical protein
VTLKDLIEAITKAKAGNAADAAAWIMDTLREATPCGYDDPVVTASQSGDPNDGVVVRLRNGEEFSPSEARWLAACLLHGADEVEAHNGKAEG